jgi:hypothetical protein
MPAGPDVEPYVDAFRQYAKAGITEVTIHQVGDDQAGFLDFWVHDLAPALTSHGLLRTERPTAQKKAAGRKGGKATAAKHT